MNKEVLQRWPLEIAFDFVPVECPVPVKIFLKLTPSLDCFKLEVGLNKRMTKFAKPNEVKQSKPVPSAR